MVYGFDFCSVSSAFEYSSDSSSFVSVDDARVRKLVEEEKSILNTRARPKTEESPRRKEEKQIRISSKQLAVLETYFYG
jgi:hypothetical protein